MEEASLRVRVNRIKKEDPQFYELMLAWRDEYKEKRKLWLDKRLMTPMYDAIGRRLVHKPFTIEDAIQMVVNQFLDDEGWEYEYV